MSLDPQISLGVKQPEPIDWTKYATLAMNQDVARQNIAASQAAQANTQAALPGIQAQSTMQQFAAQKQQEIKNIIAANTKINDDGTTTVDMPKAIDAVAKAGYLQDAQSLFANHFANASAATSSEASAKALRDSLFDTTSSLRQTMNNAVSESGDNFAAQAFNNLHKVPTLQSIIGDDPRFKVTGESQGGGAPTTAVTNPDGTQTLTVTGGKYSPGKPVIPAQAAVEASLPPSQQGTVAAQMPSSPLSTATAAGLRGYGVQVPQGLPAAQAAQLPGAGQQIAGSVLPIDAKLQAAKENPVLAGYQANANSGIAAANAISQDRTLLEKVLPTDPLALYVSKYAGDGRVQALLRAVTAANNDPMNPAKIDINSVNVKDAADALRQWNQTVGQRVLTNQSILKNNNVSGVTTPQNPAPVKPGSTKESAIQVSSQADYDKLQPGDWMIWNGQVTQKGSKKR